MGSEPAPSRVQIAGVCLLTLAALNLIGLLLLPLDERGSGQDVAIDIAGLLLLLAGGLGLTMKRRWGWPFALVVAIAGIAIGVWSLMTSSGDTTLPGADVIALVFYLGPGAFLLACLVTPGAIRWVRGYPVPEW